MAMLKNPYVDIAFESCSKQITLSFPNIICWDIGQRRGTEAVGDEMTYSKGSRPDLGQQSSRHSWRVMMMTR